MMKDEKREQYITMTPISAQWSRGGGGGAGGSKPPASRTMQSLLPPLFS